jgi:hypothetical protein
MSLKIIYVVCSLNRKVKRSVTFLKERWNRFSLATVREGGESHIWDSAHPFYVKSDAMSVEV